MAIGATEFRIQGKDPSGKVVQGFVTATSYLEARRKAKSLAHARNLTLQSIRKKKNFAYRVRRGDKLIDGLQSAYSRSEVVSALKKLGFEVRYVRRHWDLRGKADSNEIVSFVATSAKLLEQKIPYNEVLRILSGNVKDKNLRGALREILNDLKNGTDSREAFMRQSPVFGTHVAMMLGIASKSGDMTSIFRSVALLVERQADFRKGLVSALILPAVTSLTLFGAIAFYALYLLPKMAETMGPMIAAMPPLTAFTLEVSAFVQANLLLLTILTFLSLGGFYGYVLTAQGKLFLHKHMIRIPYVGRILRNTSSEIFCRVLGILYTSGENIDAIQMASEASGNHYLARQIKTVAVPMMLKYGTELSSALSATKFFPDLFLSRFKTAAETGTVKETSVQLAEYYQMENQYAMKNLISIIEVSISLVIMLTMVFLTILSSETASIDINTY
ncbi:MAG TPA: type II secretion system F family protein [Bacteroidota bacterium]|nr:type II secretion system F family protein [Bacteroidota bacterium]